MKFEPLNSFSGKKVLGPTLFIPEIFEDSRGIFYESWNESVWTDFLKSKNIKYKKFVQDNHSYTKGLVIRGLHFQTKPFEQGKLVRCLKGEIYDVVVDLRRESSTFCMWCGINLSDKNHFQLWVPEGFAHGFLSLSSETIVNYKVNNYWNKDYEKSLAWNDNQISIKWPIDESKLPKIKLSKKDSNAPKISEINPRDFF